MITMLIVEFMFSLEIEMLVQVMQGFKDMLVKVVKEVGKQWNTTLRILIKIF